MRGIYRFFIFLIRWQSVAQHLLQTWVHKLLLVFQQWLEILQVYNTYTWQDCILPHLNRQDCILPVPRDTVFSCLYGQDCSSGPYRQDSPPPALPAGLFFSLIPEDVPGSPLAVLLLQNFSTLSLKAGLDSPPPSTLQVGLSPPLPYRLDCIPPHPTGRTVSPSTQ